MERVYLARGFLDFVAKKNDILERLLFIAEKRDKATLLHLIKNEVELGIIIHSDEWRAYSSLNNEWYESSKMVY